MKRLFILSIVLALVFSGCAMFKVAPSKTSDGYTYESSISPDAIMSGKYIMTASMLVDPYTAVAFYYHAQKNIIFAVVFYIDSKNEWVIGRYFYTENKKLVAYERDEEKKAYRKLTRKEIEQSGYSEEDFAADLKRRLKKFRNEINL